MAIAIFLNIYIEPMMGARVCFDPEVVGEIMFQGMTEDEYRNAQEPFEEVFNEAGFCVLHWQVNLVEKSDGGEEGKLRSHTKFNLFSLKYHQGFSI